MQRAAVDEVERIRRMYEERFANPKIRESWEPFAEAEVAYRSQQMLAMARLFRAIGRSNLAGLRILDVGCGEGRLVRAFLDMGASPEDVAGIDIRANAIEEGRRRSPHVDFRIINGTDLEFGDGAFDLVVQFVVFSSIFSEDLRRRLSTEMMRVLRKGGYIFWWDLTRTVQGSCRVSIQPKRLFPGMQYREERVGMKPRPSTCLVLRRRLQWVRGIVDRFGYPDTHISALIGPKP